MEQFSADDARPLRLPDRPNLRHLRAQAKDLVRGGQVTPLAAAQREVAQAYGFSSWTALKRHVEWSGRLWADLDRYGSLPASQFDRVRASDDLDLSTVMVAAVEHPNAAIRRSCIGILDHLGDADVGPVLLRTLRDPVPKNRRAAIHALTCTRCKPNGLSCDPSGELRRVALTDPHPRVRAAAASSLPVEMLVSHCLADPSVDVRVAALVALLMHGTSESIHVVRSTFVEHPDLVRAAIRNAPKQSGAIRSMDRWVRQESGQRWTGDREPRASSRSRTDVDDDRSG